VKFERSASTPRLQSPAKHIISADVLAFNVLIQYYAELRWIAFKPCTSISIFHRWLFREL